MAAAKCDSENAVAEPDSEVRKPGLFEKTAAAAAVWPSQRRNEAWWSFEGDAVVAQDSEAR